MRACSCQTLCRQRACGAGGQAAHDGVPAAGDGAGAALLCGHLKLTPVSMHHQLPERPKHVLQVGRQPAMECLPLVMEPESRFYADPVIVLDFQSL